MTLEDVAVRLAAAGGAQSPGDALASLRRCRPARAPIYRDGNQYALDPHDDEVNFWLFRLGLRPPRVAARPEALVLIDVEGHEITTFMGDQIARAIDRLAGYEIIGAVDVRALLRTLNIDPGER